MAGKLLSHSTELIGRPKMTQMPRCRTAELTERFPVSSSLNPEVKACARPCTTKICAAGFVHALPETCDGCCRRGDSMAGTARPEGDRKLARRGTPALLGAAIYVTTLRPLLGRDPLTIILATFGISLVLQNYALWQFGPVARKIQEPFTGHFTLFYLDYPWYRLVIALLSAAIIGALWLFLKFGTYGVWIRATTQDRVMAQAMGIPVPWVLTGVFALGAAMAGASGVLFGPLVGVNHVMGVDWILKAFIVVVIGGMGNLAGSIAAAIFVSLLEAYAALWVSPAQAVIVSFVVLILTLLVLPEFWRRFVTEILIWGLLAMSSDLLIGYTGMVSFGHSAFFGL